jgi:gliding motility-associated-like protein
LIIITGVVTDASCNTIADGAIDITVAGGTGTYTYLWSPGGAVIQDLTNILSGTYTVIVTDLNGCSDSAIYTVNSLLTVISSAGNDTSICVGSMATLCGTLSTGAINYQWQEIPAMINVGATICIQVAPILTTSYILIASNGLCADTDTVVVTVNLLPVANAGADETIIIFSSTPIGASPAGGLTYNWTPGGGLNDSIIANPIASPTVTTTYTLVVTNASGCTAMDSVTVTVLPQIIFPSGISPNGDGANDWWIIEGIDEYPNNHIEIYNRWGELLYSVDGYDNVSVRWTGTYKNKELPVGTYYYIIDLKDEIYPEVFTGPITILR